VKADSVEDFKGETCKHVSLLLRLIKVTICNNVFVCFMLARATVVFY